MMFNLRNRRRRSRDSGMTLPEVLISITVSAILLGAMSSAILVVTRHADNNEGRINNSISEQSINYWMPGDLASAEQVEPQADRSPCFSGEPCLPDYTMGSNVLLLVWTGTEVVLGVPTDMTTRVSYRYGQDADGSWVVVRVQCQKIGTAPQECTRLTVLRDVDPPPGYWEPGVDLAEWALKVSLLQDTTGTGTGDPLYKVKDGRRVTVTVNGGGDQDGAGGGIDTVTLSAGGTDRVTKLATDELDDPPSFSATRSRCGGDYTVLVDLSTSITDGVATSNHPNLNNVKLGLTKFVEEFQGTPVKIQMIRFNRRASTVGGGWRTYYDMLDPAQVADLKTQINGMATDWGTNWEDALYRTFYNPDGTLATKRPSTLIFFTDGMPTINRREYRGTDPAGTPVPVPVANPLDQGFATGGDMQQEGWNRANRILREFDADLERTIGVFVGDSTSQQVDWQERSGGYHLVNFERGYNNTWDRQVQRVWEQGFKYTYERGAQNIWERGYRLIPQRAASGLTYERRSSGVWSSVSRSQYESNNTVAGESDNWRARVTGALGSWTDTTQTLYDRSNLTADESDGFRLVKSYSSPYTAWETTTQALYNSNNSTSGDTDGWRVRQVLTAPYNTWVTATESDYNANNSTPDDTDWWRRNTVYAAPYTGWVAVTEATYNASNTTNDETDGWRVRNVFTAPFNGWAPATQAEYNANNVTPDDTDGWRQNTNYGAPYSLWEPTSEAAYLAGNTNVNHDSQTDGWRAQKVFALPYKYFSTIATSRRYTTRVLGDLVAPGGYTTAVKVNGKYTNAQVANMYVDSDFAAMSLALQEVALAQCGGTVTVQTRLPGGQLAGDPFTYISSTNVVEQTRQGTTSLDYKSTTFDYAIPDGGNVPVEITVKPAGSIDKYSTVGWTCTSSGAPLTPTVAPDPDSGFTKLSLTIAANKTVSCTHVVTL
jgi:prepilin-type N-terminal cleavage/methylation domain-containing protein